MLMNQWTDFVVCFGRSPDIWDRDSRLDILNAVPYNEVSLNYEKSLEIGKAIFTFEMLGLSDGDNFIAMRVSDFGEVTIWTDRFVYSLIRFPVMEKIYRFDRNPVS